MRARFGDDWQQKYGEKRSKLASALKTEPGIRVARLPIGFKAADIANTPTCSPIGMSELAPKLASASVRERAASEFAEWGAVFYDRREVNETKLAIGVEFDGTMFHGAFTSGRFRVPMQDGSSARCWVVLAKDRIRTGYDWEGEGGKEGAAATMYGFLVYNESSVAGQHRDYWKANKRQSGNLGTSQDVYLASSSSGSGSPSPCNQGVVTSKMSSSMASRSASINPCKSSKY